MVFAFTLLLGLLYPLLVMALSQTLFHHKANGSLIGREETVMGSALLGQSFEQPKYFWGRLSATLPPYNATASAASNMSPANAKLLKAVNARIAALQKADPKNKAKIPVELVTASGSGLDPHISVKAAEYQLRRVATYRNMKDKDVRELLEFYTQDNAFGLLGEPYVNVVQLNMALDKK